VQKNYELLEHTADIAVRIKGNDLEALFRNSASAMFDIMAEAVPGKKSRDTEKFPVKQEAADLEELFINWLNELLSLSAAKGKVFCKFIFKKLDEHGLEAEVSGADWVNYKINTEIKAATYHELEIKKMGSLWQAKVIFDV
jgi:SHS2 domain-containing protein